MSIAKPVGSSNDSRSGHLFISNACYASATNMHQLMTYETTRKQCALCSVHCAVCTVQCALCSVHCAVCTVQCAVCTVQCALCCVQCAVCTVQCALCTFALHRRHNGGSFLMSIITYRKAEFILY